MAEDFGRPIVRAFVGWGSGLSGRWSSGRAECPQTGNVPRNKWGGYIRTKNNVVGGLLSCGRNKSAVPI